MSQVLTVRIDPVLLRKAEARASRLGMDRAGYVRDLIRRDLEKQGSENQRRFASEDLVGKFRLGGSSATNEKVREQLRQRVSRAHEAHR